MMIEVSHDPRPKEHPCKHVACLVHRTTKEIDYDGTVAFFVRGVDPAVVAPKVPAVVVADEPSPKRKCLGDSESQAIDLDSPASPPECGDGSESQAVELDSPSPVRSPLFCARGSESQPVDCGSPLSP